MRHFSIIGALALAGASLGIAVAPSQPAVVETPRPPRATRRRRSYGYSDTRRKYKTKNPPTKRKLRANRNTVSKRVRRKHRRAA